MSDAGRAVLIAGLIAAVVLLIPIGLLAAGAIGAGTMLAVQIGVLATLYLLALALRRRRDAGD